MKKILNRLAVLILAEMERMNCSCTYFADICGISRNEMGKIINRQKTDIKLSTIDKICTNSHICMEDVFCEPKNRNIEIVLTIKNGKCNVKWKKICE